MNEMKTHTDITSLTPEELEQVSGGVLLACIAAVYTCYEMGTAIGKAAYYLSH